MTANLLLHTGPVLSSLWHPCTWLQDQFSDKSQQHCQMVMVSRGDDGDVGREKQHTPVVDINFHGSALLLGSAWAPLAV